MKQLDTLIIGAGIAGLTAARLLTNRSRSLTVVDKGRGVGGRVATRRLGEARADHGAACFSLKGDARTLWDEACKSLSLQAAPHDLDRDAWTCPAGMNALAKAMAEGLPVQLQETVETVELKDGLWTARSKEGSSWSSRSVLITSPLWQTAEFFKETHPELKTEIQDLARRVTYDPQWTLMIRLAPDARGGTALFESHPHPLISSVYDQGRKGLPHALGVWVVQASQDFSLTQIEADPSGVISKLSDALRSLGWNLEGAEIQAHRWRYARVRQALGQNFVTPGKAGGLFLAGDFCLGSTVDCAATSGWAAGDSISVLKV